MRHFAFRAQDAAGQQYSGTLAAEDQAAAMRTLVDRDYVVTRIEAVHQGSWGEALRTRLGLLSPPGLSGAELAAVSQQLAAMLEAGVPFKDSLEVLCGDQTEVRGRRLLLEMATKVAAGSSVGEIFAAHPDVFSRQYIATMTAGESGGHLPEALRTMAVLLEKKEKLRQQLVAALYYPGFLVVLSVVFLLGMLVAVVPRYAELYASLGGDLPAPTRCLMAVGAWMNSHVVLWLGGTLLAIVGVLRAAQRSEIRLWLDRKGLGMPGVGPLLRMLAVSRFCRTLSALLSSGLPLVRGLQLATETMGNRALEADLTRVAPLLVEGWTLVETLRRSGVFTEMALCMCTAGERSGKLDNLLALVATYHEEKVEMTLKAWASLVEPAIILVVGAIVAAMIVIMVLPVFKLVAVLIPQ